MNKLTIQTIAPLHWRGGVGSILCILAVTVVMAGCSGDDDNISPVNPDPKENYDNLRDSIGTATRPTDWGVTYTTDPTNQQIITLTTTELPTTVEPDDLLAAFAGEECRAVASLKHEVNGKTAFTLVVMGRIDEESNAPIELELRYYSHHNKRIYLSDKFRFRPGETLGSLNTGGYKAKWR